MTEAVARVNSALLSWDLLRALGVQPALGRDFMQADDSPAANGTVLLSWGLVPAWRASRLDPLQALRSE